MFFLCREHSSTYFQNFSGNLATSMNASGRLLLLLIHSLAWICIFERALVQQPFTIHTNYHGYRRLTAFLPTRQCCQRLKQTKKEIIIEVKKYPEPAARFSPCFPKKKSQFKLGIPDTRDESQGRSLATSLSAIHASRHSIGSSASLSWL